MSLFAAAGLSDEPVADNPLLEALQKPSASHEQVRRSIAKSGGRRSSALIVLLFALLLLTCATLAALLSEHISLAYAVSFAVASLIAIGTTGKFRTRMVPDFAGQLFRLGTSIAGGALVPSVLFGLVDPVAVNLRSYLGLALTVFAATMIADFSAAVLIRRMWARGRLRSRALIVGSGTLARELAVELQLRREYGVDLVGVLDTRGSESIADLLVDMLASTGADRVIIAPLEDESVEGPALVRATRAALALGVPAFVVPRLYEMGLGLDSLSPDRARGYPLVRVQRSAHPSIALRAKRLFDILVSAGALLLLSPVLLVAMLAVKITSPGPVLFRQQRVGQGGHVFDMLKFRSMHIGENQHAERLSAHRITVVGRVLRATAVDELPQFWNILRGDMSIVGPRPERVAFVEEGLRLFTGYDERHRMPMGLTGLAQVAGLRGEDTSVRERVKFDNLYIDQWSFGLDVQIVLKTVFAVLLQTKYRRRERELATAITNVPPDWDVQNVIDFPDIAKAEV